MRRMYSKNQLKVLSKAEAKLVKKDISTLVDKDGHDRFIEGDIELDSGVPEGVEKLYAKWSLSGSHLMIVICFSIANGTVVSGANALTYIDLPKWVMDKIVPITSNIVDSRSITVFNTAFSGQSMGTSVVKTPGDKLRLNCNITATDDRIARYTLDLLIDNE